MKNNFAIFSISIIASFLGGYMLAPTTYPADQSVAYNEGWKDQSAPEVKKLGVIAPQENGGLYIAKWVVDNHDKWNQNTSLPYLVDDYCAELKKRVAVYRTSQN